MGVEGNGGAVGVDGATPLEASVAMARAAQVVARFGLGLGLG